MNDLQVFVVAGTILAGVGLLGLVTEGEAQNAPELTWVDGRRLAVEGQGWTDTESFYDRLPARAQAMVPGTVWGLSHDSAGYCLRFRTDAPQVHVKWEVLKPGLAMPHMPATGVSGVDLYARRPDNTWRFVANGRPQAVANEAIFSTTGGKDYALYLPLYNGVKAISLGVAAGKTISPPEDAGQRGKPVVFYGTSITQGGCASRPGMAYTAIVGRKLNVPVINLGFSGAGQMEPALAELLAELDPSVYVLDCLWNMSPALVTERIVPFVKRLRVAHPATPILLAEDSTPWGNVPTAKGKLLRGIFEQLKQEGVPGLYFVAATGMMGPDDEGTVDGCHPTDLGFMYQAQVFAEALRPILGK